MNKSISDLIKDSYVNAVAKGFYEKERSFGEAMMLITSEASEAFEDYRNGHAPSAAWYEYTINGQITTSPKPFMELIKDGDVVMTRGKPCGIPSELADIAIRLFDTCGYYGIDLEAIIRDKMEYNETRTYQHGGKVL